jgi:hypothetical protein
LTDANLSSSEKPMRFQHQSRALLRRTLEGMQPAAQGLCVFAFARSPGKAPLLLAFSNRQHILSCGFGLWRV